MFFKRILLAISLSVVFLSFSTFVYADLYWESVQKIKNVPGFNNTEKNVKNYLTSSIYRTDFDNFIIIMDFNLKNIYQIDVVDKKYNVKSMESIGNVPSTRAMGTEEKNSWIMENIEITPTKKISKISGYSCMKFNVTHRKSYDVQYWVSDKVTGFEELMGISYELSSVLEENPMLKHMTPIGLVNEMQGFPVRIVTEMSGGTVIVTLDKIEQKELDEDIFKVPDGYVKVKPINP
jgi:hypothetical protein